MAVYRCYSEWNENYTHILQQSLEGVITHVPGCINSETFHLPTYPSCFHFIPRGTAPSFPIWKNFTFLSLKTWLHVAPPLLFYYWSYKKQKNQFNIFYLACYFSGCTFKEEQKPPIFPATRWTWFWSRLLFLSKGE